MGVSTQATQAKSRGTEFVAKGTRLLYPQEKRTHAGQETIVATTSGDGRSGEVVGEKDLDKTRTIYHGLLL